MCGLFPWKQSGTFHRTRSFTSSPPPFLYPSLAALCQTWAACAGWPDYSFHTENGMEVPVQVYCGMCYFIIFLDTSTQPCLYPSKFFCFNLYLTLSSLPPSLSLSLSFLICLSLTLSLSLSSPLSLSLSSPSLSHLSLLSLFSLSFSPLSLPFSYAIILVSHLFLV